MDKISPVKEQDIVTSPIKSKEYVKRQAFVRRKLNIRKAQKVLLNKCNTKIGQKAKSKCVPKLKESGEGNKETVVESKKTDKEEQKEMGESVSEKMFVLHKQVEVMIAEGKSEDESTAKIETLKSILAMLQASQGSSKVYENIRKINENKEKQ